MVEEMMLSAVCRTSRTLQTSSLLFSMTHCEYCVHNLLSRLQYYQLQAPHAIAVVFQGLCEGVILPVNEFPFQR